MDPMERVKYQSRISVLRERATKQYEAIAVLDEAEAALKGRKWDKVPGLVQEAERLLPEQNTVLEHVVARKYAKNIAEARRLVERGLVSVDGAVVNRATMFERLNDGAIMTVAEPR